MENQLIILLKELVWDTKEYTDVSKRSFHTSTIVGNYLVTIGGVGRDYTGSVMCFGDIVCYNLNTEISSIPIKTGDRFEARQGHTACAISDDKILVFGGMDDLSVLKEVGVFYFDFRLKEGVLPIFIFFYFEDSIARWELKNKAYTQTNCVFRANHTSHVYKKTMYTFGGRDKKGLPTQELWTLDLG